MKAHWLELTCEVEVGEGETLALPEALARQAGPGRWVIRVQPAERARPAAGFRNHSAFLNGYTPEDEGLYDDAAAV